MGRPSPDVSEADATVNAGAEDDGTAAACVAGRSRGPSDAGRGTGAVAETAAGAWVPRGAAEESGVATGAAVGTGAVMPLGAGLATGCALAAR